MKELLEQYVVDKFGNISIPKSNEEKTKLARALLGLSLIRNLDNWLSSSFDLIDKPEPEVPFRRENALSKKDRAYREAFANLDDEVKAKIKQLIYETTTGVLFSSLITFDQFDFGDLNIKLTPKTSTGTTEELDVISPKEDLHDEFSDWIENFSKYQDLLNKK